MKKSKNCMCECGKEQSCCSSSRSIGSNSQAVYGIGMIGAAVYYLTTTTGFWVGVLGILKAIVWPGFVVYELMKYLQM